MPKPALRKPVAQNPCEEIDCPEGPPSPSNPHHPAYAELLREVLTIETTLSRLRARLQELVDTTKPQPSPELKQSSKASKSTQEGKAAPVKKSSSSTKAVKRGK